MPKGLNSRKLELAYAFLGAQHASKHGKHRADGFNNRAEGDVCLGRRLRDNGNMLHGLNSFLVDWDGAEDFTRTDHPIGKPSIAACTWTVNN